jgi:hypothetical protein
MAVKISETRIKINALPSYINHRQKNRLPALLSRSPVKRLKTVSGVRLSESTLPSPQQHLLCGRTVQLGTVKWTRSSVTVAGAGQ